jgi:hypothetical protein
MIRYLTLEEVLELHHLALEQSGGLDREPARDMLDCQPELQHHPRRAPVAGSPREARRAAW